MFRLYICKDIGYEKVDVSEDISKIIDDIDEDIALEKLGTKYIVIEQTDRDDIIFFGYSDMPDKYLVFKNKMQGIAKAMRR